MNYYALMGTGELEMVEEPLTTLMLTADMCGALILLGNFIGV